MRSPAGGPPPAVRLVALDTVGSTNDEAFRLAREGAGDLTLVTAVSQDAGRGRRGRAWTSPPGNFYGTFLLDPCQPLARLAELGFVAAVATVETCRALLPAGRRIEIKWPNDVLVDGAKVSGILVETEAAPAGRHWVAVGIGINVGSRPDGMPYDVTALAWHVPVTVESVRQCLAERFACWYRVWLADGFAPVRAAWAAAAVAAGRPIEVRLRDETLEGRFAGIDDGGALLLDQPTGRRRVTVGDVMLRTG